jgi:excisionase family DNA binding protein
MNQNLLSVEDAAAYLGIRPGTLRNWLAAVVKVGGCTRLQRSVLEAYIAANTIAAHQD